MADFTFAHREEGFDEHIEKSIRGYSQLMDDVISLSRHFVEKGTSVVDIGCSTGKMTKALIDYNLDHIESGVEFIGIEIADGFQKDLRKREEEIKKYYSNVHFEQSDARYYDYKRKSFTTEDIMDKERTLRHMMKPNTWREIEDMLMEVGFGVVQPFWRNHAFVGALAVK